MMEILLYIMGMILMMTISVPMLKKPDQFMVLPQQQVEWLHQQTTAMVETSDSELAFNAMGNLAYPQTIDHANQHLVIFMAAGRSEIHQGQSDD